MQRGQLFAVIMGGVTCGMFWLTFLYVAYESIVDLVKDTDTSSLLTSMRFATDVEAPAAAPPSRQATSTSTSFNAGVVTNATLQDAIADCTQRLLTRRQLREACLLHGLSDRQQGGALQPP